MERMVNFTPQSLYFRGNRYGWALNRELLGYRASQDLLEKEKIPCSYRESNHSSSVVQPVVITGLLEPGCF